jgi:hypothetical protein
LVGGLAAIAVALVIAVMVRAHPEELRAPAWVAYVAASAFGFAGLSLLAGLVQAARLRDWLGVAVALSMLSISAWVALGPGERACSMSIGTFGMVPADIVCRGAFGFGSLLMVLLVFLAVRHAMRSRSQGQED